MTIRVLLADDHAVMRDGLRLILERETDITVVGDASDGREAVKKVRQLCPDAVVMDIAMPELNGIEATIQVREISPSTQIVILSMHSTTEHIYRALKAGARGFLLKESAGREVVAAIRAILAGRRYLTKKISENIVDDYLRDCRKTFVDKLPSQFKTIFGEGFYCQRILFFMNCFSLSFLFLSRIFGILSFICCPYAKQ